MHEAPSSISSTIQNKNHTQDRCWWLTPVILATQDAEIRRIAVQKLAQANSLQDHISKKNKK
jgi:hypothetical protein